MSNATDVARLSAVSDAVGRDVVSQFGGFLRCETCRSVETLTPAAGGKYLSNGWPKCCGYTMRWWTARQVRNGEVPA